MAFAASNLASNLVGYFREVTHGRPFEYKMNPNMVLHLDLKTGRNTVYPHLIFVGPNGDEVREALVKKTVAYVFVDEVDSVYKRYQKWKIKNHRVYTKG